MSQPNTDGNGVQNGDGNQQQQQNNQQQQQQQQQQSNQQQQQFAPPNQSGWAPGNPGDSGGRTVFDQGTAFGRLEQTIAGLPESISRAVNERMGQFASQNPTPPPGQNQNQTPNGSGNSGNENNQQQQQPNNNAQTGGPNAPGSETPPGPRTTRERFLNWWVNG